MLTQNLISIEAEQINNQFEATEPTEKSSFWDNIAKWLIFAESAASTMVAQSMISMKIAERETNMTNFKTSLEYSALIILIDTATEVRMFSRISIIKKWIYGICSWQNSDRRNISFKQMLFSAIELTIFTGVLGYVNCILDRLSNDNFEFRESESYYESELLIATGAEALFSILKMFFHEAIIDQILKTRFAQKFFSIKHEEETETLVPSILPESTEVYSSIDLAASTVNSIGYGAPAITNNQSVEQGLSLQSGENNDILPSDSVSINMEDEVLTSLTDSANHSGNLSMESNEIVPEESAFILQRLKMENVYPSRAIVEDRIILKLLAEASFYANPSPIIMNSQVESLTCKKIMSNIAYFLTNLVKISFPFVLDVGITWSSEMLINEKEFSLEKFQEDAKVIPFADAFALLCSIINCGVNHEGLPLGFFWNIMSCMNKIWKILVKPLSVISDVITSCFSTNDNDDVQPIISELECVNSGWENFASDEAKKFYKEELLEEPTFSYVRKAKLVFQEVNEEQNFPPLDKRLVATTSYWSM